MCVHLTDETGLACRRRTGSSLSRMCGFLYPMKKRAPLRSTVRLLILCSRPTANRAMYCSPFAALTGDVASLLVFFGRRRRWRVRCRDSAQLPPGVSLCSPPPAPPRRASPRRLRGYGHGSPALRLQLRSLAPPVLPTPGDRRLPARIAPRGQPSFVWPLELQSGCLPAPDRRTIDSLTAPARAWARSIGATASAWTGILCRDWRDWISRVGSTT